MKVQLHDMGVPVKAGAIGLHEGCAHKEEGSARDDHEVDQDVTNIRGQRNRDVQDNTSTAVWKPPTAMG